MRWPFTRTTTSPEPPRPWPPLMAHPADDAPADDEPAEPPFVCSTCGRTDLPETGGWDPPICLECDAQINYDVDMELDWHG